MVSTSLRPATLDDLSQVLEIESRCHSAPWGQESFANELGKPQSRFLLLTDDETDSTIYGYVVYWVILEECQILNIVVDSSHRKQGYAKKMLDHVVQDALKSGCKKIILDVRKSNSPAIQLYQGAKFTIIHIRKRFYSNGEDAYQMELALDGDPLQELFLH